MISPRPAKHVIIGKVVLDLGIVPRTRADLEPRTDKSEFVNGIGDGAGGAVYPQLVCGDDGYVDEGIVDADIAEGEDVDLVIGEQVSPASAQETSVDRDIQREIQVRLARRCAVGGQETACPERLKRIRVAEEEAHPKVVLVVMKCAIPISRKLVVGKAAGIAAGERSGLSEGDSSGNRRNQGSIGAAAELVAALQLQQLEHDGIDLRVEHIGQESLHQRSVRPIGGQVRDGGADQRTQVRAAALTRPLVITEDVSKLPP